MPRWQFDRSINDFKSYREASWSYSSLDHGIRVVGIYPGDMENERGTMFLRRYAEKKWGDPERWREMIDNLPGSRAGTSDDMAAAIVFLSSPRASYINGVVLTIDGGLSARQAVI